jgi:hypothetical protein
VTNVNPPARQFVRLAVSDQDPTPFVGGTTKTCSPHAPAMELCQTGLTSRFLRWHRRGAAPATFFDAQSRTRATWPFRKHLR